MVLTTLPGGEDGSKDGVGLISGEVTASPRSSSTAGSEAGGDAKLSGSIVDLLIRHRMEPQNTLQINGALLYRRRRGASPCRLPWGLVILCILHMVSPPV